MYRGYDGGPILYDPEGGNKGQVAWSDCLAHELSHYLFGLGDEYCFAKKYFFANQVYIGNACFSQGQQPLAGCKWVPDNHEYGMMEWGWRISSDVLDDEYSNSEDYPPSSDLDFWTTTEGQNFHTNQAAGPNGRSCWDQLMQDRFVGSPSGVRVIAPAGGSLSVGTGADGRGKVLHSSKRAGPRHPLDPDDGLPDSIEFTQCAPAFTVGPTMASANWTPGIAGGRTGEARKAGREGPGLVSWSEMTSQDSVLVSTYLQFDSPLSGPPDVAYVIGSSSGETVATPVAGDTLFVFRSPYSLPDSLFEGSAVLSVRAVGVSGDTSVCVLDWEASLVHNGEVGRMAAAGLECFVPAFADPGDAWTVVARTVGHQHRGLQEPLDDALRSYSLWSSRYLNPSAAASLTLGYLTDELPGVSTDSLRIGKWDPASTSWTLLADPTHDPIRASVGNAVSSLGVYGLFYRPATADTIPPGVIGTLGAFQVPGRGRIGVVWNGVGDDGGFGAAEHYVIKADTCTITDANWSAAPIARTQLAIAEPGAQEYAELTATSSGQPWFVAAKAIDDAGNVSALSNVAWTLPGYDDSNYRPSGPTDVRAVDTPADSGGSVFLSWSRSNDDGGGKATVRRYRIYRTQPPSLAPTLYDSVAAGTTAYVDSSAGLGMTYTYWVSAADSIQETFCAGEGAFSARNLGVPVGDFSSDTNVGLDDLSRLVDAYGIDSTDTAFDPLFDLDNNGDIYTGDFEVFRTHFGEGSIPSSNPPGHNAPAQVRFGYEHGPGDQSFLNIRIEGASNLAGCSFKVTYPASTLSLAGATADSAGITGNLLNQDGGLTPLFLASEPSFGVLWIANAIKGASAYSSPEGDGLLARISFTGSGIEEVTVTEVVLMDSDRLMNYQPAAVSTVATDADGLLRPFLYQSVPNPFNETTTISFSIPQKSKVSLKLFDVQGRLIRNLVDGMEPAGIHPVVWDRRGNDGHMVASGVYFYRFKSVGYEKSRKLVLLR